MIALVSLSVILHFLVLATGYKKILLEDNILLFCVMPTRHFFTFYGTVSFKAVTQYLSLDDLTVFIEACFMPKDDQIINHNQLKCCFFSLETSI